MKINSIHVNGFGVWNDRTWSGLSPGLNVFHGPNETGKSTLMAFLRSILFGFERRGTPRRYEPLAGGVHGGWLDVEAGGRALRIERKPGRHIRGTVAVYEGDAIHDEKVLEELLAGTTRTLYHNVFAFGLEELEQFHTLQENEIAAHISGAGLGIGAARWASVQKDLEDRQSALFLPRGQNTTINSALKELDAIREDLERTARQPEEYLNTHEMRVRLAAEVEGLENAFAEVAKRVEHYARRAKSRPHRERRARIEARLAGLPPVDSFPEGGIERLKLLTDRLRGLEADVAKIERSAAPLRLRRMELQSLADPLELTRRAQIIESLRTLVPRMDAARRVYSVSMERRDAVVEEKRVLDAAQESERPPSEIAFFGFVALIWFGGAALVWGGWPYMGAALGAVSLFPLFWYRMRRRHAEVLREKVAACSVRLGACVSDLRNTENEAREIEAEIRRLTGRTDVTPEDIEMRVHELERISRMSDEIRDLDQAAVRSEAETRRLSEQIAETGRHIAALLAEGSAADEAEFIQRSEIHKQRLHLLHELDRIPAEAAEPGLLFDFRADEEAALQAAQNELADLDQRLAQARHESGRVEERIVNMEKSEERSRALSKQETIVAQIDSAAEQWAVVTLCRALLDETRKIYETERQPDVLRQASSFFKLITESKYCRVIAPLDGGDIQVERADGLRLSPQLLSRGTGEQLYLAMRLALVREYANHVEPLPVIFDDIFVNFDPERTRNCILAVRELAASHQVLLFTCHPHFVAWVEENVPSARMFPLQ
jgi:uncharacterized protein YhaN